jgi:NAD(P)-dependent dehydrogenase (short-subunit alcohol dehydrogenase family)
MDSLFDMKRNELKGKVAIITGASSGTGRATTFAFVREGVNRTSDSNWKSRN